MAHTFHNKESIIDLFIKQLHNRKDQPIVIGNNYYKTYNDIYCQLLKIASYIKVNISGSTNVIGIYLIDNINLLPIMLSIISTGNTFVLLDPLDSKNTLNYKIIAAKVTIIISDNIDCRKINKTIIVNLKEILNSSLPSKTLEIQPISPSKPIYILFTSGSTGSPKGILVSEKSLLNRLYWMWETYPFDQSEVLCQKTNITFVDSMWEIFGGILQGIPTVYMPSDYLFDTEDFINFIKQHSVTRITLTPSFVLQLLENKDFCMEQLPSMKILMLSGEALLTSLAKHLVSRFPYINLLNLYGSSEVAGDVTFYEYKTNNLENFIVVPLGIPIINTKIYLLNNKLQPVTEGKIGEIYVSGANLALGYLDIEQTKKSFINHKLNNNSREELLFKTGDLGQFLSNGILKYCGRSDRQIKYKGIRIDPAEIENCLLQREDIKVAAVILQESESYNEQKLIAFVQAKQGYNTDVKDLKLYLQDRLNKRIVPNYIILLKNFPYLSSGKIDYRSLAKIKPTITNKDKLNTNPCELESSIIRIWEEVLKVKVTINDNFFELGGDSLHSIRVLSRIRKQLQIKLSIHDIFNFPTIKELATLIQTKL